MTMHRYIIAALLASTIALADEKPNDITAQPAPMATPSSGGPLLTKELIWLPGDGFSGVPFGTFPLGGTIRSISCRVEIPAGMAASFYVVKAPNKTPLTKGAKISMPCNGNGTAATNQNLLTAVQSVSAGDAIGIAATNWTGAKGVGSLTVGYSVP